jgi:hypothetical protein
MFEEGDACRRRLLYSEAWQWRLGRFTEHESNDGIHRDDNATAVMLSANASASD